MSSIDTATKVALNDHVELIRQRNTSRRVIAAADQEVIFQLDSAERIAAETLLAGRAAAQMIVEEGSVNLLTLITLGLLRLGDQRSAVIRDIEVLAERYVEQGGE
jgi:hypothetical protein